MNMLIPPVSAIDHVLGDEQALVTLVEFGDYECSFCGRAHPFVEDALRRLGAEMRFVFRNFPLAQVHPHALAPRAPPSLPARSAKFWPMHDMLFENQDALAFDDSVMYAERIGLNLPRFANDLENGVHLDKVRRDFRSGVRSAVTATPTFFIDGVRFEGRWSDGGLTAALSAVIRDKKSGLAEGAAPQPWKSRGHVAPHRLRPFARRAVASGE